LGSGPIFIMIENSFTTLTRVTPSVVSQVSEKECIEVGIPSRKLVSVRWGIRVGHIAVKEALDTLRKVLLEVSHSIVGSAPDVGGTSGIVEPLQFPIEVWVDESKAKKVERVGKLVDGDVLSPVPVVAVAEGILLRRGAKRYSHGCSETSSSLIPVSWLEEGVLRQVGGQLGWVPCHHSMAEATSSHRCSHPGVDISSHLTEKEGCSL